MNQEEVFERVVQVCRDWGGDIIQVSEQDYISQYLNDETHFFEAPFSSCMLGIDWPLKRIIWANEVCCAELLHEMGHLFACREDPLRSKDYNFFGWEYLLARQFGIVDLWVKSNRDYCVMYKNDSLEFGDLTEIQKQEVLAERVEFGQKLGIILNGAAIPLKVL